MYYSLTFDDYTSLKPSLTFNGAINLGLSYNLSSVQEKLDLNPDILCAFTVRQVIMNSCRHFLAEKVLCGQHLLCASTDSLTLPGIKLVRKKKKNSFVTVKNTKLGLKSRIIAFSSK